MRKTLLYLLLFPYSIAVLKPVFPTISDTIAHIFWYSQHMATVHYEHGKYHVHLEYADAAKKGSSEKNNTLKEDESVNIHVPPVNNYDFTRYFHTKNKFTSSTPALSISYKSCNYPPPKTV